MPAIAFLLVGISENIIGLVIASPLWLGFSVLVYYLLTKDATTLFLTPDAVEIEKKKFLGKELIIIPKKDITNIEINKEYRGRGNYIRTIKFCTINAQCHIAYLKMEDDISPLLNAFDNKNNDTNNQQIKSKNEITFSPSITINREDLKVRNLIMEEQKRIENTKTNVIFNCVLILLFSFLFTGLNWLKGRKEKITYYRGSIGYHSFKITFKIDSTAFGELPKHYFQYIRYGMTTHHLNKLNAQIISSEINPHDIDLLFVDNPYLTKSSNNQLFTENTYLGYFSLRGNYWSYPFSSKIDLYLDSVQVVPKNQIISTLTEKSDWKAKIWIYILMNFTQLISFASFFAISEHSSPIVIRNNIIEFRKKESILRISTILTISFALATIYKTFVDSPFNTTLDWIWECILYGIIIYMFYKVANLWNNSKDYIRFTDSRLEFKDNEREMSIPYNEITDFELHNVHNEKGMLTSNSTIVIEFKNKKIEIETKALNVGECDLEIADLIYKKTGLPRKESFWEKIKY
ncbi:MAG: hypothetical protein OHK0038_18450 [Flammeovirgaceae bacterium]